LTYKNASIVKFLLPTLEDVDAYEPDILGDLT